MKKLFESKSDGQRVCALAFTLLLVALFFLVSCAEAEVTVMLADMEGVSVLSENPLTVPFGSDASFELALDEDVAFDALPDGVTLEDNVLRIKNVRLPATLMLDTHRRVRCDFFAEAASENGTLVSSAESGEYWSDTEISLTATPNEGFLFAGYSIGAPAKDGGELVSLEPSYSFTLSGDVKIYANFAAEWVDPALTVHVPDGKWVLLYHSNGGVLAKNGREGTKTVEFSKEFYLCPNTLADRDYFERDGYVLLGYNTKADGTGEFYGTGWNVPMPERGAISLFCVWAKESAASDFKYGVKNGEAIIQRYLGSDEFVVIPEKLGGKPVTTVMKGAFNGINTVKRLMITKNIHTLENGALENCPALTELYFCDTVRTLTDAWVSDCPELSKLYMLAVVQPKYMKSINGMYSIKYERLITSTERKLIIASGSNSAFGIYSPRLRELLAAGGHDYDIVNYGCNAGTIMNFYCEVISKHINPGDIVLLAPEVGSSQFGANTYTTVLWQIFEGAYNAFSEVDIRHYSKIFSSFAEFNATRDHKNYSESCYEEFTAGQVNEHGDRHHKKEGMTSGYRATVDQYIANGGYGTRSFASATNLTQTYLKPMNRTLDMIAARGGKVLYSFAVVNRLSLNPESQTAGGSLQRNYEQLVDLFYHAERISSVSTYVMDSKYFYDADYHTTTEGSIIRTENLARDILAYLN